MFRLRTEIRSTGDARTPCTGFMKSHAWSTGHCLAKHLHISMMTSASCHSLVAICSDSRLTGNSTDKSSFGDKRFGLCCWSSCMKRFAVILATASQLYEQFKRLLETLLFASQLNTSIVSVASYTLFTYLLTYGVDGLTTNSRIQRLLLATLIQYDS